MYKLSNNARTTRRGERCGGFTLIEAVMALSILMVGFLAVLRFFPLSLQISGDSQGQSTASALATAKIEELRDAEYDALSVGTIEPQHAVSEDPNSYLSAYQRTTLVSLVDGSLNPSGSDVGLKLITTTVTWRSAITKGMKTYSLTTLASRN